MKAILQRVLESHITVDGTEIARINQGLLVLVAVSPTDTQATADKLLQKLANLRLFADAAGKTNLSITDIRGELLLVSQFTLYGDTKKGNRPSFTGAAGPEHAQALYQYMIDKAQGQFSKVAHGVFGADMKVSLVNNGPFTVEVNLD